MKKLLLIDDNIENQRESYGATFVDDGEYDDILINIDKLNEKSDFSFLDGVACVMLHDTLNDYIDGCFRKDSHIAKDTIKDILFTENLPAVFFSDGHSTTFYDEAIGPTISSINKKEFYQNLKNFVIKYKDTEVIDLGLLAFGEKPTIVEELLLCARKMCKSIKKQASNEPMAYTRLDEKAVEFFIKAAQPAIGIKDANTFYEILEDSGITAKEFKNKINAITDSFINYGHNIHSW